MDRRKFDSRWGALRGLPFSLGKSPKAFPELFRVAIRNELLEFPMRLLPRRESPNQQRVPFACELQGAAPAVRWTRGDLYQALALQWLQRRRQRGSIHCQQGRDRPHGRRFRSIQRHQQRELPVRQAKWTKHIVKAPCQRTGCPLHVKTQTAIPNQQRCFVRKRFLT